MTESITPIDPSAELRSQVADVVRSTLRTDTRPIEGTPSGNSVDKDVAAQTTGPKTENEHAQAQERKAEQAAEVERNLALRFRVDPDTHAVTVLLVDQATKRIVRSVPPEDLQKLNSGDLVHLLV